MKNKIIMRLTAMLILFTFTITNTGTVSMVSAEATEELTETTVVEATETEQSATTTEVVTTTEENSTVTVATTTQEDATTETATSQSSQDAEDDDDESEDERFDDDIAFDTDFKVTSKWDHHCNAQVTIKNTNDEQIDNWEVAFTYAGEIENVWNARIVSHENDEYIIKNVKWNQDIQPGEQIQFGFTASYDEYPDDPCDFDIQKMEETVVDGDYNFEYKQFTRQGNYVQGQIELTNTSDTCIEDWQLQLNTNIKINNIWNAEIADQQENYEESDDENETESESDPRLKGYTYYLENCGYNQNIEPGQTINFGFEAECLDEADVNMDERELTQLTVQPDDEEEESAAPETDEQMPEVDLDEADEDDLMQMEADEEDNLNTDTALPESKKVAARAKSTGVIKETVDTITNQCNSDKLPYQIVGLAHTKQIQAWYLYKKENLLFVVQDVNDKSGTAVISLCTPDKKQKGVYHYQSEIQVINAGHVQTIYCYCKKKKEKKYNRYYLLINCHGVKYTVKQKSKKDIVWSTRIGRVVYNTQTKEKINSDKLSVAYDNPAVGNCIKQVYSSQLKQFKALAYSNSLQKPFAGMANKKTAEIKRVEFGVSPVFTYKDKKNKIKKKKYLAIVKKSGKAKKAQAKIEYSLYNGYKLLSALETTNKNKTGKAKENSNLVSFNSKNLKQLCMCSNLERKKSKLFKRGSIQGVAVDQKANIYITSGDDKLEAKYKKKGEKGNKAIAVLKKRKTKTGYTKKIGETILEKDVDDDVWLKDLMATEMKKVENSQVNADEVPYLEIEGAQIYKNRIYYVVGTENKEYPVMGKNNESQKVPWRNRGFVFSRALEDIK